MPEVIEAGQITSYSKLMGGRQRRQCGNFLIDESTAFGRTKRNSQA
jgi:hypothetical protein